MHPELLEEDSRRGAIPGDDDGTRAVGDAGDDAERADDLDNETDQDDRDRDLARLEDALRLLDRVVETENLIERAEWQKQHHQSVSDDERDDCRRHHSRSLMISATRSALAMIVSVGFTAPIEGKKLASVT